MSSWLWVYVPGIIFLVVCTTPPPVLLINLPSLTSIWTFSVEHNVFSIEASPYLRSIRNGSNCSVFVAYQLLSELQVLTMYMHVQYLLFCWSKLTLIFSTDICVVPVVTEFVLMCCIYCFSSDRLSRSRNRGRRRGRRRLERRPQQVARLRRRETSLGHRMEGAG